MPKLMRLRNAPVEPVMVAADLLNPGHPLHDAFKAFVDAEVVRSMNKRQARKFMASLPNRGAAYRRAAERRE